MKRVIDNELILDIELTPENDTLFKRWTANYYTKRNEKVIYTDWKIFSNYYKWAKTFNNWQNLQLFHFSDDSLYNEESCVLCSINLIRAIMFTNNNTEKMIGAHYDKTKKLFRCIHKIDSVPKYFPRVSTEMEAHHMWLVAKIDHLSSFHETEDSRVVVIIKQLQREMKECLDNGTEWKPKKYLIK